MFNDGSKFETAQCRITQIVQETCILSEQFDFFLESSRQSEFSLDGLESFYTIWKVSLQSEKISKCLKNWAIIVAFWVFIVAFWVIMESFGRGDRV